MATLRIEATPGENLQHYTLEMDDDETDLIMVDNACTVEVPGTCGDRSVHNLYYALFGAARATLGLKIFCGEELKVDITLKVRGFGPVYSSDVEFDL